MKSKKFEFLMQKIYTRNRNLHLRMIEKVTWGDFSNAQIEKRRIRDKKRVGRKKQQLMSKTYSTPFSSYSLSTVKNYEMITKTFS